jgi:hypothetical protein
MSAEIIDLVLYRRRRAMRRYLSVGEVRNYVLPVPGGDFEWVHRSEFTAEQLSDIDFFKVECGL